nr:uncharacterized protein LOC129282002 [Lytechinus pictus]
MGEDEVIFDSYEEFKQYLDEYEKETMSHFITVKKEKKFSESDYKGKCLHWRDSPDLDCCIPYVNVGQLLLGCHQGRDKNIGKKEQYKKRVAEKLKNKNEADKKIQSRFRTHATKKLDCPAVINLKKIAMFPGFKEDLHCSPWTKRKTVSEFQQIARRDQAIDVKFKYVAKFPGSNAHKYHVQGQFAGMREPIDPLVRKKVVELVGNGITKVADIQKAIRAFVVEELFPNESAPSMIRRRYYPSARDIKNLTYVAKKKVNRNKRKGKAEEEAEEEVEQPEEEADKVKSPSIKNLKDYSESKVVPVSSDGTHLTQEDLSNKSVLFCHQTKEQQRLLQIYGSMIVMDIVYRSATFPADVVFLFVRTNVDYQLVAGFVGEAGTAEAVEEGFLVMKDWNPNWKPEFFVMDHKVEMMEMIKRVFPGSDVFVSDFHREKLWKEWFHQQEPDMDQSLIDKTLDLIKKTARAPTRDQYEVALKALQGCEGWISSVKLQSWFATSWEAELWVMAFQPDKLCILLSAMNGPDKLNDILKVNYFQGFAIESLLDVIQCYKEDVVPTFLQRYLRSNIRCSSSYGKLNTALPAYLRDRPLDLVTHIIARSPVPSLLTDNVVQLENGTFTVLNEKGRHHSVGLGNEIVFPSCTCSDWLQHWLPCRHFLAVFHHLGDESSWQQLSPLYSSNPIFSLDEECILQQMASPETTPHATKAVEVNTRSAPKQRAAKRRLAKLHESDKTLKAVVSGDLTNDSVQMVDVSKEENQVARELLTQMGATPSVKKIAASDGAAMAIEMDASSPPLAPQNPEESSASHQESSGDNVEMCDPHESQELSESERVEGSACTSPRIPCKSSEREDDATSVQTLQDGCSRYLEQLLHVTPTLMERTVLQRVFNHLESALNEATNSL